MDKDTRALLDCHVILTNSLDVNTILPHMNKYNLLTRPENEKLTNPYNTTSDKVNYLVEILPRKGNGWLDKLICCLKDSTEGTGHSKIIEELQQAKRSEGEKGSQICHIDNYCVL